MSEGGSASLINRRAVLGGALGGLAATAAAPGAWGLAAGASGGDSKQLVVLLGAERRLSATYRRVLAAGVLNVVVAAEVSGFAAQEREHIGALERELLLRGAHPQPQAPIPPTAAVPLETQADALGLLLAAENMAETAYLGAMAKLQDPGLVRLAAEILASEAQHWTLLRVLQAPQDLAGASPVAFVTR